MAKSKFQKIMVAVIVIGVLAYLAVVVFSGKFESLTIEDAVGAKVNDVTSATGYVFRNEVYVYNESADGAISYAINDGDIINKGGTIAGIYSSEDEAVNQKSISELQKRISELQKINMGSAAVSDLNTINNALNSKICNIISKINRREFMSMDNEVNSVVNSINQRRILVGDVENYDTIISELEAQLNNLSASTTKLGTIKAQNPGYFISNCDGYENSIDYTKVMEIDAQTLDSLAPQSIAGNCVGKIITDFSWYIAAKVSSEEALRISQGDTSLTIDMPFAVSTQIPVTVVAVNQVDKKSDGVVILKCDYMNSDLAKVRKEAIQINMSSYSGIRIPKKAIHDDTVEITDSETGEKQSIKVQGVYVLNGEKIEFKEISILYSGSDYVICDPTPEEGKIRTSDTVGLYDQIITQGVDLYDGKVIQ